MKWIKKSKNSMKKNKTKKNLLNKKKIIKHEKKIKMKLKINKCLVCGNNFKNLEKFDNELDLCFKCFISYEKHQLSHSMQK